MNFQQRLARHTLAAKLATQARRSTVCAILILFLMPQVAAAETVIDFDDFSLGANSYWNGSDNSGGFTSQGVHFNNVYDSTYSSWEGFAYSNVNNTTIGGWENQYAAYTGTGYGGSGNYAVTFCGGWNAPPIITLPEGTSAKSLMVTNATYPALIMLNGSSYPAAKKFGGPSGNDPDWFKLTINGKDELGNSVGSIDFLLADYRFVDNSQDFLLDTWQTVDLTPLAAARQLEFSLSSTDNHSIYGMNTPAYFAMDNLVTETPEPGRIVLWLCSAAMLFLWRLRRRGRGAARGPA